MQKEDIPKMKESKLLLGKYISQLLGIDAFVIGRPLSSDDERILCEKGTYQKQKCLSFY